MNAAPHLRVKLGRTSFSLIELMMVISIIIVLIALLMPAVKTARESARKARCSMNMRQFGLSFRLYQSDHRGMYPNAFVGNADNWQSYLCGAISKEPWIGPSTYVPPGWLTYDPVSGAKRINGRYLCPSIAKTYNIPQEGGHAQWGYCLNQTRTQVSYQTNSAGDWPYFQPRYIGYDLDVLYPKAGISAVMTCGNAPSWNSDNDWNALTGVYPNDSPDWPVKAVHNEIANVLFLDGHVEGIDLTTISGQAQLNYCWYNNIPSTLGNPW